MAERINLQQEEGVGFKSNVSGFIKTFGSYESGNNFEFVWYN